MSTNIVMLRAGRVRNKIVAYLTKHPGATSEHLSEELGMSRALVSSALSSLHKTGATARQKVGQNRYAYMLRASSTQPSKADNTLSVLPSYLVRRLTELEAFKAEAIKRHPDLIPVDYEGCRAALTAFYTTLGLKDNVERIHADAPLTDIERRRIDALIAAARLLPAQQGWAG